MIILTAVLALVVGQTTNANTIVDTFLIRGERERGKNVRNLMYFFGLVDIAVIRVTALTSQASDAIEN